MLMENFRN